MWREINYSPIPESKFIHVANFYPQFAALGVSGLHCKNNVELVRTRFGSGCS